MDPIYDLSKDEPLSETEIQQIRDEARALLQKRAKSALIGTILFFLACLSVVLCCAGFPLHRYWDTMGRASLIIAEIMLVVWIILVGWLWSAWSYRREIEKEFASADR